MRALRAAVACSLLIGGNAEPGSAQSYPTKPIELVVPFAPGGGTDILARLVADGLTPRLGQRIVVVNRAGANSIVGTQAVARAQADGYTLLLNGFALAANPLLYKPVPFDTEKQLTPIVQLVNAPTILVVPATAAFSTVGELIAALKAKPGELTYASFGNGSNPQLTAELFLMMTGTRMTHVPYNSGAPAVTAVAGGHVSALFPTVAAVTSMLASGKLKPVAVASARRLTILPNVPTFRESGVDLVTGSWFGLMAPAGTPRAIIERLNSETNAMLREAAVKGRIEADGSEVVGGPPEHFGTHITAERTRLADIITKARIKAGD